MASAAFRKNRSYNSFFWVSLLIGPLLPALIIAVLPFDSSDPKSPQYIRESNPVLAARLATTSNNGMNRGFQVLIAGLVGLGILVSIIGAIADGIAFQASSSTGQIGDTSVALSGQKEKLVSALEENCADAPKPLTAVSAKDEKAGHYQVTGYDGTSGAFYLLDKGNGMTGVLADSSDDISGAWVCGSFFTVSR